MAQSGKGLTARPAESEATWSGYQLLTRAIKFAEIVFFNKYQKTLPLDDGRVDLR
jgi:hypothetical protein